MHAATLPGIDNGHMIQDHVPSASTLVSVAGLDHFRPHCRRARVTEAQVRNVDNRAAFSLALSDIPSTSWSVPLDTHYSDVSEKIFQAIEESFPPANIVAKKPHISVSTLHKVAETRSLKQQLRFLRQLRASGDFSSFPLAAIADAINHSHCYLKLLSRQVGQLSLDTTYLCMFSTRLKNLMPCLSRYNPMKHRRSSSA